MRFALFGSKMPEKKEDYALQYMYITVASQILLACAIVLLFFVYLPADLAVATGGVLFALLFGSLLCWKSIVAAEAILMLSLLFIEFVVHGYFPGTLLPFVFLDVLVLAWLAGSWNVAQVDTGSA
jgi:hypothetical protein